MKKPTWIKFDFIDYLTSQRVRMMTLEEKGAYFDLICYCAKDGAIPADPEKLAKLLGNGGSTNLATNLQPMFNQHPTNEALLVHEKVEEQMESHRAWLEKSRRAGLKSAETRKNSKNQAKMSSSTNLEPTLNQPTNQTSTNRKRNSNIKKGILSEYPKKEVIESIYQAYPRKRAPKEAKAAIEKALAGTPAETLLEKVQQYAEAVNGKDKTLIPYPATWFNRESYNEDPKEWEDWKNARQRNNQKQLGLGDQGTQNEGAASAYAGL